MRHRTQEKLLQISIFILSLVMIILRFLLNEKGRVNPDSLRFMRTAEVFPVIDNTTTPLGYPLSLKFFTIFGLDLFWASKVIGIFAYIFIVYFAWKKRFYLKETILVGGLFSYISIFSYTMSESLILPFMFLFLYVGRQLIIGELTHFKGFLYLSLALLALYNIRYPALFIIVAVFIYGVLNYRKSYGKIFIYSSLVGVSYVVLYKSLFIDYFNEDYIDQFLEIGLHSTSKLLIELVQGLATTFNPFIHIANPAGGLINYGIYGIGLLNILLIAFIIIQNQLSETERFFVFVGISGIICSFFIQYFYSVNPIDYRLMAPFSFPIWLVYFRKIYQIFGKLTYGITILSLITGFIFTWLSRGNYLENRREIVKFLKAENLEEGRINFFMEDEKLLDKMQIAELISTVNPNVKVTFNPKDTLQNNTLTKYKVLRKIKIDENKYQ